MSGPGRLTVRREWVALFMVSTVAALLALLEVHTAAPAWISAVGAAVSVWAIYSTVGAAVIRRRQDRR